MRANSIGWSGFVVGIALAVGAASAKPPPREGDATLPPSLTSTLPRGKPPPLLPGEDPEELSGRPSSSGTGFIVAEGKLLTNDHVVDECARMVARNARGERHDAKTIVVDRRRDLALLDVPRDFGPALTFRDPPGIRRGEPVVTYGFPLAGLLSSGPTLTTGDVSALSGLRDSKLNIQISAPVQPGNSGGPLLDGQALVIGVVVSKLNAARIAEITDGDIPQNVNFAVTGTETLGFLREHGVTPATTYGGGPGKGGAAIGDVADPSTVYLQCFK